MPTIITARRLLTDIGSVEFPVLIVGDDGTLTDISSDPTALAREEDTLTCAFFDVHTHGAMGHDVMSASPADATRDPALSCAARRRTVSCHNRNGFGRLHSARA